MIKKLPQSVINEIAAGEVIQRPQNVENSIDAGAKQINITINQGGLQLLKICDNGKGIMQEDFPLLCARFATSKIQEFSDMKKLDSFGFRGEALASLSYVSNLTITSKWHLDQVGHSAVFKNEEIVGKITDVPLNVGTTIMATELFLNSESRRASLNPQEEKKKICRLLSHFCLHYPKIKFDLITEKGNENLPCCRTNSNINESKMQIFQQITKLSYDKFSYIPHLKVGHGCEIEAIITKINTCKGKTLMLNINNRIVENPDLFKAIEKAYSECYQSIHEDIESFWVYMNMKIEPQLIDCNVHPTKKAVGIFAGYEIYENIKENIINQVQKDSAIKVLKVSKQIESTQTTFDSFRGKMNFVTEKNESQKEKKDEQIKVVYAHEKNRTDSKQLPLQFFSQKERNEKDEFWYFFERCEKNQEIKKIFGEFTYVGCFSLNHILIHYQNKLFMLNIVDFIPSFVRSFAQSNKFITKKINKEIKISFELEKFIQKTKLLESSENISKWIEMKENCNIVEEKFGIKIENNKLISYPCLGDVFTELIDQEYTIGQEITYFLCRIYNSIQQNKLNKKLEDKFFEQFISSQFIENQTKLSPFNSEINNFFKNKIIPILKTNPFVSETATDIKKNLKEMLDLKDVYKIFERC